MKFTMRTANGKRDFDPASLEAELLTARDVEEGFIVLERDIDGAFVQYNGEQLEFGRDGVLHRFDSALSARQAFERFMTGSDLSDTDGWHDVTGELVAAAASRWRSAIHGGILVLFVAALFALIWFLARPAS